MNLQKYFIVTKNTWEETLTYRLNFTIWRFRTVLRVLTVYFLWLAVLPKNAVIGSYNQELMLTYILGTTFIGSIVFATRTLEIGDHINNGDLSNFLIRPVNYFLYWFFKDLGDKAMNTFFSIIELIILFIVLKPPFFIQTNLYFLSFCFIATFLSVITYFFLSFLIGLIGFWSQETWAPRFIFFTVLSFLVGDFFPLDIMPQPLFFIAKLLPFYYMLYFPLKIYLGGITQVQIYEGLIISIIWMFIIFIILKYVWNKGIKSYTAYGG